MTLIEVLSAEIIGGIVISAAIVMVLISMNSAARVTDRVNGAAQGRVAMELIQQRLHSQTCLFADEYYVNGSTPSTGSQVAFVHADPSQLAFFADIGATGGATGYTGGVGFQPQLRYLYYDSGPTTGQQAFRRGGLLEGYRPATTTVQPFNFNVGPTGTDPIGQLWTVNNINATANRPTRVTRLALGVTNDVTGVLNTPIPLFTYYDSNNVLVTMTSGAVPTAQLGDIARVNVSFRIVGESGKDSAAGKVGATGPSNLDRRMTAFSEDSYLRTSANSCN
jgi:hypothetical protein